MPDNVFTGYAFTKAGEKIVAAELEEEVWDFLKASYTVGDFTMPCCPSAAIPKTSMNGVHFFAHQFGECTSAPESKWHVEAKQLVASEVRAMGLECDIEKDGRPLGLNWIADTFFVYEGRQIVVELQHSYQTFSKYRDRQKRYGECGIECYWLLYRPRYLTVTKSMCRWRIKHEFGGKFPDQGLGPCVSDIPIAFMETEPAAVVRGAGVRALGLDLREWLTSILERRFSWNDGTWVVSNK